MKSTTEPDSHSPTELSLVIPLYNEEEALLLFFEQLSGVLSTLDISTEVILVDDGSQDRTFEIIEKLAEENSDLIGLCLSRNFGKEAAMLAGLERAKGRAVAVMDGDGQHPPEILPELLGFWQSGEADIVTARKQNRETDRLLQRVTASLFNRLMKSMTSLDLSCASDYRLMDRRVVDAVLAMRERRRFFRGMSSWVGFREKQVPFRVKERLAGESGWNTWQLAALAVSAITSFTARPLVWVMGLGASGLGLALLLTIQALISRFNGTAVSGWTSLTVLILFFGSANLMAIGLVGVYLARIFDEVKERPVYILQKTVGIPPAGSSGHDHSG